MASSELLVSTITAVRTSHYKADIRQTSQHSTKLRTGRRRGRSRRRNDATRAERRVLVRHLALVDLAQALRNIFTAVELCEDISEATTCCGFGCGGGTSSWCRRGGRRRWGRRRRRGGSAAYSCEFIVDNGHALDTIHVRIISWLVGERPDLDAPWGSMLHRWCGIP